MTEIANFGGASVPGPGKEVVSLEGRTLDRNKYTDMLKEYYYLRGWDEETGLPKKKTLTSLGLDDLASIISQ